jgi:HemY protein
MIKLLWRLALLIIAGLGFAWLADRPGTVDIQWMDRQIQMSVLFAAIALAVIMALVWLLWHILSKLWRSPRAAREYWRFRKHRKAYDSLSRGLIAASAGDAQAAYRLASQAQGTIKDEPLLTLLAVQAAQLKGDRAAVKKSFEEMAKNPATEVLGLRGLFAEAKQSGDLAAAIQHAEKALALNPRLAWASTAMLQIQSARKDWSSAAKTISNQGKSGLLPRAEADRKRASLLAAEALNLEDSNRSAALSLATEAHALDQSLVPASLVAARCHIANGSARKAMRVLRDAWAKSPHPDIAEVTAHTKSGEGPEEQFEHVRDLVGTTEDSIEGAYALARAAIQAKRFEVARKALEPHIQDTPQARICELMAIIEEAADDKGRTREWLSRAIHAPRDPMWVSDGVACPRWTPLSPVTGEIVPCEWKAPFEMLAPPSASPSGLLMSQPLSLNEPSETQSAALVTIPGKSQIKPDDFPLPRLPDDPGVDPASEHDTRQITGS